ncbi:MAG: M48 family metalloprotease [Pararhodobacter sp.]
MLRLAPLLLAILYALVYWHFSAWRTRRELDANATPLKDPEIERLTERMARALDLPGIRVHVYEIAPINGLAAPDGRIFLTRGFLDLYAAGKVTAAELASVIAHELGHVALGHARRRMIDFSGQNAVRVALSAILGRLLPGVGVWIANMLVTLLAAHLSRRDEYEADEYAAALLTRAGIGTAPQRTLLGKLDGLVGARGAPPVWMASHPPTPDRIRAIEALESRWRDQA